MHPLTHRLPKEERLHSRKLIDKLYAEGFRFNQFPFHVAWMPLPEGQESTDGVPLCQFMVVVPKRRLKHAVDRNRVKRLARECYRLDKDRLTQWLHTHGRHIALALVYTSNEVATFSLMEKKMNKLLVKLEQEILSR